MARYTDSVCRMCRREGTKLFLKGEKCFSSKCAQQNRPTPPGQHGQARQRKASEYGLQLREKQKARRAYGLMEGQFKRSGLAASRAQARQLVCHGLMTVNGKKVDIPSYTVKQGDVIGVKSTKKDIAIFKAAKEGSGRVVPKWLTTDLENLTATVAALPQRDDVDLTLQENMIVEFYSR